MIISNQNFYLAENYVFPQHFKVNIFMKDIFSGKTLFQLWQTEIPS